MTDSQTLLWFRGFERLLIVLGGIGFVFCGMLLYKWGVAGPAKLVVQHNKSKAQLTNAAPGAIVMLFGAVLLGLALSYKAELTPHTPSTKLETQAPVDASPPAKWIYDGPVIDQTRMFLEEFRGNRNKKLTEEQVQEFRRRAGDLLTELDAAEERAKRTNNPNPKR